MGRQGTGKLCACFFRLEQGQLGGVHYLRHDPKYKNFKGIVEYQYPPAKKGKLRVEVSDTGCGVNPSEQQRIFDRFYRIENAVHTEAGTGLGLSIVRDIIEKHGGTVRMASVPEVGTTFWFDLPLEQADADELMLLSERKSRINEMNELSY